ncbi:hypothetical protein FocnCong_v020558 [Fusarium oxysporum f. sp. conglutinans]|nr:hypothetical protein FocnCong_v020558 [Fusarium oxysporum f. sp. conglutinans]
MPIYKATSRSALLAAFERYIEGHESLHRAGLLDRDISINNLMINEDDDNPSWPAFVIDLGLATKESREAASGAKGKTGTRAFMAIGTLLGEQHSFMHDLESFFWVLFWICIHYNGQGKATGPTEFESWNYETDNKLVRSKAGTIGDESIFLKIAEQSFNLVVYDLDDDDLYDLDDGDSKDDELDCLDGVDWGTHSRNFDYLSFASGIVVNGLSHRQLRSFSWDLGTCIPETILGPSGIITLRQDSVENISLTTDRRCFIDDDSTITWCPHSYNQGSTIHLDNFKNLKSFRWRGPRCEDIDTLSSAIKNNRTNLIKLELDFVGWDDQHGDWFPFTEQSNECRLLTQILGTPPHPPSPIFLKLQELSISFAPIGPAFASALDIRSLVSLKLHYCSGWTKFVEKVTESSITLKLKTFEICDYEFNDRSEEQKAITDLLGSFSGLEKLHIFLGHSWLTSWIPTRDFWASVLRHRATLKSCILDPLWGDRTEQIRSAFGEQQGSVRQQGATSPQRQNFILQQLLHYYEMKPRANVLNLLDVECLGLINEPTCLRRTLLPFAEKDCLRIIHIRTGDDMGSSWEWNWVWKDFVESEGRTKRWSGSYSGADLRALWPHVAVKCARYRLQDKFCAFVEWAFGAGGIASLRAIVVGDFSINCKDERTRFSICRNEDGIFTFLDGRDGRWDQALDDYQDFLASCR